MLKGFYRTDGKRLFDLAAAISAIIVLAPVLVATALLVRIKLGSPVLFRQERPGLRGRLFRICKFRTMTDARDAEGNLLHEKFRLTAFGKFLRASSIDELPELWNVLLGEMSLVGPRPLWAHYLSLYSQEQARRHNVRPGITGWAQVNGRNTVAWEERFRMDVWYVDNVSFGLDLMIIWKTLSAVINRQGISAKGHSSMPLFQGAKETVESDNRHEYLDIGTLLTTGVATDVGFEQVRRAA